MRYLLDTNIISEALKTQPNPGLADWIERQPIEDLFIATLTVAELWRGVLQRAPGRRKRELTAWFEGPTGPRAWFGPRILPFDVATALKWAELMSEGTLTGRPRSAIDMIVAATAAANACIVVTANERHFEGIVEYLNPLKMA